MKFTEQQIKELSSIFDDIITSDSEAVQSAFQRLAFLSSLAKQERDEPGPFTDLVKRLDWMEREIVDLRRDVQIVNNGGKLEAESDVVINLGGTGGGGTMIGGGTYDYTNLTLRPLTSNDIVSLSSMDISTITLTSGST